MGVGGSLLCLLYSYTTYLPYILREVFYLISEKPEESLSAFEDANTYECVILAPDGQNLGNGLRRGYLHLGKGADDRIPKVIRNVRNLLMKTVITLTQNILHFSM